MYKENRAAWRPAIEQSMNGFKAESTTLAGKQAVVRQGIETSFAEQKTGQNKEQAPAQKSKPSALDRVAALRDKNKDRDGAERER